MKPGTRSLLFLVLLVTTSFTWFVWISPMKQNIVRLDGEVAALNDSLAVLQRDIDTLRAQTPGLGEYMSAIQLHVTKLWFAAKARNWELAAYERGELGEAVDGAEQIHAKKKSVDVSAVLESVKQTQIVMLDHSIAARDLPGFEKAYTQTLAACNGCHRPAGYPFVHIIIPKQEPVTNQEWGVRAEK